MAMLAEPRQRRRYNLTPRGKALYEDESRFGTKMLEKMGWAKGKGLGANEDGGQDFVRVRMRNTNEGLGYEDRDDHWTQHEQDFNGLLNSLNGEKEKKNEAVVDKESVSDEETPRVGFGFAPEAKKAKVEKLKDKISGISLEEKSKQSKVRVHYKKFTKGKDVAQYSEKDLANIFGKKAVESEQADGIFGELTAFTAKQESEKEEKVASDDTSLKSNLSGVQTISTGISVNDYFKQKMEAMKSKKQKLNNIAINERNGIESLDEGQKEGKENKKKNKNRKLEVVDDPSYMFNVSQNADDIQNKIEYSREKHESSKKVTKNYELENETNLYGKIAQESSPMIESKKEKKKRKSCAVETIDLTPEECVEDADAPKKKKAKFKDCIDAQHYNESEREPIRDDDNLKSKKKKKTKKSEVDSPVKHNDDELSTPSHSKKKKDKTVQNKEKSLLGEADTDAGGIGIKKLKEAKNNNVSDEEECPLETLQETSQTPIISSGKKLKKQKEIGKDIKVHSKESEAETNAASMGDAGIKKFKKGKYKKLQEISEPILVSLSVEKDCRQQNLQETSEVPIVCSGKKSKHKKSQKDITMCAADGTSNKDVVKKQSKETVSEDISFQLLTLDELIAKCNSFNVFNISTCSAEKFRYVDLGKFKGATLSHFPGYSYNAADLKLNVEQKPQDEKRILELWNCTINKYQEANPSAIFRKYRANFINAYKSKKEKRKQSIPRFHIKSLQRKNVFQSI